MLFDGFLCFNSTYVLGPVELESSIPNPMFGMTKYLDLDLKYNFNYSQFHNLNSILKVDNWNSK